VAGISSGRPTPEFHDRIRRLYRQANLRYLDCGLRKADGAKQGVGFCSWVQQPVRRCGLPVCAVVHDSKAPVIPVLFTWPSRGELRLRAYTYDRESANYSRDALESLLSTLATYPSVAEISLLAHSMGNWVALEALRGRSIRQTAASIKNDKLKNALLVAPDVDADVFRTQIERMGAARPRIALFVSQDDDALSLSKTIWGDVPRLGDIDPAQEPYRTELGRDKILVFDLTRIATAGDDAHDRAFSDVTSVMGMIKQRLSQGQSMSDHGTGARNPLDQISDQASAIGK
jgi:esterase/lipase superfamily enzyme